MNATRRKTTRPPHKSRGISAEGAHTTKLGEHLATKCKHGNRRANVCHACTHETGRITMFRDVVTSLAELGPTALVRLLDLYADVDDGPGVLGVLAAEASREKGLLPKPTEKA